MRLSIIIPALNEASKLPAALRAATVIEPDEILVVDGGSTDATKNVARREGCRVLTAKRGRGAQLSAGADAANGDWLLFLHADTGLGAGAKEEVQAYIRGPANGDRAAAFKLAFDSGGAAARRVAAMANWRTRTLGLPYGDQGLLIHRALYREIGGYPDQPLMEDVAIARKLGRARLHCFESAAVTSAVRYERDGWVRRPLKNLLCLSLYLLGVSPERVARLYR